MHLLTHKPDKIGSAIQEAKEFFVYRVADNTIPDNPRQMAWFDMKAPRQSAMIQTPWTLVRVLQLLNSCLFAGLGMAFARVIVLNIRNPNGVSCPGFAPRLFFQAAGLRYSVQKWNARPARWTSVLLPISRLFKQGRFKWVQVCKSIQVVNGHPSSGFLPPTML